MTELNEVFGFIVFLNASSIRKYPAPEPAQ